MKRLFACIVFILSYGICLAQNFINNDDLDTQFAFQVKQIDEFFERFNFDNSSPTFLKKYLDNNNLKNKDIPNREFFLKSLFVHDSPDTILVKEFISFIDNSKPLILLTFYDSNWYALLSCDFSFLGKPKTVQLVMKNQVKGKEQSKWVIFSVKSELFKYPKSIDSTRIMSPMSHAVDFMTLNKAFADKTNSSNYYRKDLQVDELSVFQFLVQNNILKFEKLNSINYYFFQIPDWFFRVDYFNRQSNNSGWLISQIMKMTVEDKIKLKKEILNITIKNE